MGKYLYAAPQMVYRVVTFNMYSKRYEGGKIFFHFLVPKCHFIMKGIVIIFPAPLVDVSPFQKVFALYLSNNISL